MIPASRGAGSAVGRAQLMPCPPELDHLKESGIVFRRGQLIMLAGRPGSLKSAWATWLVNLWGLPTLYISADMSQQVAISRLAALRSGATFHDVADAFEAGGKQSAFYEKFLAESRVQFMFDDSPSLQDIEDEVLAWVELLDEWPTVLVLDNLLDVATDEGDEYRAWRETVLWLKGLCHNYGITVLVLHHAREVGKEDYPAPRKDLQGKVSQTPEITLSMAISESDNKFRLSCVKNRSGKQDAAALTGIEYSVVPERLMFMPIGVWEKPQAVKGGWGG